MTKRMYIMVITLILLTLTVSGATASTKFPDVADYWATDAIYWAVKEGVVEGYPDGTFKPTQNVKEAEFATILSRYVSNTDKSAIGRKQEGKHWSQSTYDELERWELPLKGYSDDKVKDSTITRGEVARVVAAKNGFNLDERQAIYYMYENDLSTGMIPGQITFDSYGVDKPLQRDQITQFMKSLSEKGVTTFMGKPSVKGESGAKDMVGIVDVPKETVEITDDMFDKLAEEKGLKEGKGKSKVGWVDKVANSNNLTVDDSIYDKDGGFSLREKVSNNTIVDFTLYDDDKSFEVLTYDFGRNKKVAMETIEATGKVKIDEIEEIVRLHLEVDGMPQYRKITGGLVEVTGDAYDDSWLTIRIFLD